MADARDTDYFSSRMLSDSSHFDWTYLLGLFCLAAVSTVIAWNLKRIARRHPHLVVHGQEHFATGTTAILSVCFLLGLCSHLPIGMPIPPKTPDIINWGALVLAGGNGLWYGIRLRHVIDATSNTREQLVEKQLLMQSVSQSQQNLLLKEKVRESKRKHLKSQMNPHFIFNVLTGIQNLLQNAESQKAGLVFSRFRRLLMLGFMSQDRILGPLSQEMEHVEQYLELECLRLNEPIRFEWDIASDVIPNLVPCPLFILQPLVENAIWHGLNMEGIANRQLRISIHWRSEDLIIAVSDNGYGLRKRKEQQKSHKSRGTSIVRERLALLRHRGELLIADTPENHPFDQGVTSKLVLPLWALEPSWHESEKKAG